MEPRLDGFGHAERGAQSQAKRAPRASMRGLPGRRRVPGLLVDVREGPRLSFRPALGRGALHLLAGADPRGQPRRLAPAGEGVAHLVEPRAR